MEYTKDKSSQISFSLHDSKITKMIATDTDITLEISNIHKYKNGKEKLCTGIIKFTNVDYDESVIIVFNNLDDGRPTNKSLSINEYIKEYPNAEFEIFEEACHGTTTIYQGRLWKTDSDYTSAFMIIHSIGNTIFTSTI